MKTLSILLGDLRPDFILPETLADIFKTTALHYPNKNALVFNEKKITYKELDRWSDSTAEKLLSLGISRGNIVGVWLPRSIELHVAILGIVKAGATYIPLDKEMPIERVENILTECKAKACFSKISLNVPIIIVDISNLPDASQVFSYKINRQPSDWAYILYTSGSTGKPKGIPITQAQICNFVRSENSVLKINNDDKVYQGFSVSFDMWCEETWISYLAGATLFVAHETTSKAIDELSDFLRKNKITVLHAVPSLLSVIEDDIPTIRLINAGGETCTTSVLEKWSTGNRIFFNSYGPTETTISASISALKPKDKISIGKPLPNYNLAIVDGALNVVPRGEIGELVISGMGVGEGYFNLPELTQQKFVDIPKTLSGLPGKKLYRTGDAAIIQENGTVEFHGRFDDQVKIRGYRIELGEIENQLSKQKEILAVAVAVKKDTNSQDELVGYVVLENSSALNSEILRRELAKVLPQYMVPGIIMILPEMPRLSSGKINRKMLPVPEAFLVDAATKSSDNNPINPFGTMQEKVFSALKKVFPNREIKSEMDFFTDLGGHSLLAATFVSRLRKETGINYVSLKDVYQNRPLKTLINHWENAEKSTETKKVKEEFHRVPQYRYFLCWFAQSFALLFIFGLFAGQVFFPYLGYYYVQQESNSHFYAVIAAFVFFCFIPPALVFLSIILKWLVIGKIKEGNYPLWGTYYFRWWFVNKIQDLVPIQFLNGTPLFPRYLRMRGMNVSKDAQISNIKVGAEDLISIGKDVSISSNVVLNNVVIENGLMKIRSIAIENHAYIGTSAVIAGGTSIEAWGELKDLSYLPENKTIKTAEVWNGSPAQKVETKNIDDLPKPLEVSNAQHFSYTLLYTFLLIIFPLSVLLPLFPVIYSINELDNAADDYDFRYMVYMPIITIAYILVYICLTVILSRILLRKIKPGIFPVHSGIYVRKWLADQFMSLSLIILHPIYATLFIRPLFRALGAKVGKNAEISTASNVTHPLLTIGKGAFVADAVILGETDIRGQKIILEETIIGENSFIGNSAVIHQLYSLTNNTLIGVLSTPPTNEQIRNEKKSDWFGSPAIAIPKRQESKFFSAELTTTPSPLRFTARGIVELIRIIIPETIVICLSILLIAYGHDLLVQNPWWKFIFQFPLYYLGFFGLPAFLITVLLKWIFVGRYKSKQFPIWSVHVWLSEAITAFYEALSVPFLLEFLKGTPWLPFLLRFLGVKIGKRVWMETTDITEYDMVKIGDDAALNFDCGPQTHLFEDRVMKIGPVQIGARSSIGSKSIILYDSEVDSDVQIEPLSLVMKGEKLSTGTIWTGSPVRTS
jgi:non-ribosomal peptide synthetase-like protein